MLNWVTSILLGDVQKHRSAQSSVQFFTNISDKNVIYIKKRITNWDNFNMYLKILTISSDVPSLQSCYQAG